jgi:hypothetical protein
MAYAGYLIRVGNYTIPQDKYIKAESYSAYVNMQDYEPWTDANGYVHRTPVDLKALKVEFETPAMLTNTEVSELFGKIRENYKDSGEKGRMCEVTAYIPEYDEYVTQMAYLADFTPQIYRTENTTIWYNPIRLAFIGGVADD